MAMSAVEPSSGSTPKDGQFQLEVASMQVNRTTVYVILKRWATEGLVGDVDAVLV